MRDIYKEKPEWEQLDLFRNVRDLGGLVLDEIANLIPIREIKEDSVESPPENASVSPEVNVI